MSFREAVARFRLDPAAAAADASRLLDRVSVELRAAGACLGITGAARGEPGGRFAATLTLAVDLGSSFRFILIGDSAVRLNTDEVVIVDSGLDQVTATLRQEAYRAVQAAGGDLDACRSVGRACAFHGAGALRPRDAAVAERGAARGPAASQPGALPDPLPPGAR